MTTTLAVDCMGGDHGPAVTLPACRRFLERHPDVHLLLVGRQEALQPLAQHGSPATITALKTDTAP